MRSFFRFGGCAAFAMFVAAGCSNSGFISEHPVSHAPPALKPGVYAASAVTVRPIPIHEVEPDYPEELGSILSGKAVVAFTVGTDGKVTDASVVEADDILFGEAALHALAKWRFQPARLNSDPVACRLTLPFIFTSPYGGYVTGAQPPAEPSGPPPDAGSQSISVGKR